MTVNDRYNWIQISISFAASCHPPIATPRSPGGSTIGNPNAHKLLMEAVLGDNCWIHAIHRQNVPKYFKDPTKCVRIFQLGTKILCCPFKMEPRLFFRLKQHQQALYEEVLWKMIIKNRNIFIVDVITTPHGRDNLDLVPNSFGCSFQVSLDLQSLLSKSSTASSSSTSSSFSAEFILAILPPGPTNVFSRSK